MEPLSHCISWISISKIVFFVSRKFYSVLFQITSFCFLTSYSCLMDNIPFCISLNAVYMLILNLLFHYSIMGVILPSTACATSQGLDFLVCTVIFPCDSFSTRGIFCRSYKCVWVVKVSSCGQYFSSHLQRPNKVH